MPVHRVPGGRSRTVFAYPEELQEWLAGADLEEAGLPPTAPSGPSRRFPRGAVLLVCAAALVLVIAAIRFDPTPVSGVARLATTDRGIEAFDGDGRRLWQFEIPGLSAKTALRPPEYKITDVDGDGRDDVVLALIEVGAEGAYIGSVRVIGSDGRLRWQRALDDRLELAGSTFGPTWLPDDVFVYRAGGETRISAAFHHHTWWPSIVATFDREGQVVSRFVNSGWIYNIRTSPDGARLYAAGVSNPLGGAVLAVFDATNVSGRSPDDAVGPAKACRGCPSGLPLAYFLMPWSDVARPEESPRTMLTVLPSGEIELHSIQVNAGDSPALILTLSPSLEIVHSAANDATWPVHAQLERDGVLSHPASQCPWRDRAPVRVWGRTP